MDHLICFVGPSGSGKTTIAQILSTDYNVIQSYTTRPKRSEDEWGHTFADSYIADHLPKTLTYNKYNSYEYWITEDQYTDKGLSLFVVEPVGEQELRKSVKNCKVTTIFFTCPDEVAFNRMCKERGKEKALQRLKNDKEVFVCVPCDYVVDTNRDIDSVLKSVRNIISMHL